MQINIQEDEIKFQPFTIEIKVTTVEEAAIFFAIFNNSRICKKLQNVSGVDTTEIRTKMGKYMCGANAGAENISVHKLSDEAFCDMFSFTNSAKTYG